MNMKVKTLSALAGLGGALIMCSSADAAFTGLSTQSYNTTIGGNARTIWRVYANFTSPTEGTSSIGPIGTAMTLQAQDANGVVGGGGAAFFAGGNPSPPSQYDIDGNPAAAHRSFYTIGLTIQDQNPNPALYPLLNVAMPAISGNTVTAAQDSGATTTTPDAPFALAGWSGQNRVLILQLQVQAGNHVKGTIGLNTVGSEAVITATFNSIPAPGALALLGLAGLVGSRRRRA